MYNGILSWGQYGNHKDIPALPCCHITLKAQKPLPSAYPQTLKTLGDHLRKKRLDLNILQKKVAQRLSVGESSIYNRGNNLSIPSLRYIPKIVEFLGYAPYDPSAKTTGEKIVTYRQLLSLSQKKLAHRLGIDPSTLGRWEKNKRQPTERILKDLNTFFIIYAPHYKVP